MSGQCHSAPTEVDEGITGTSEAIEGTSDAGTIRNEVN